MIANIWQFLHRWPLCACLTLFVATPVLAQDAFRLSGFGTIGISHDNSRDAGFLRNTSQPLPEDSNTTWLTDSLLGLQGNYRINPQFEAVAQLVVRDKKKPTLANSFEWAYLAWRPMDTLDLRVGKTGLDTFLLSDYRHVSFAQPWVRPPREFYGWIPLYSVSGADATYHYSHGDTHWHLKTQLGQSKTEIPTGAEGSFEFKAEHIRNLSLRMEQGPWQFMVGHASFKVASNPIASELVSALNTAIALPAIPALAGIRSEAADLKSGLWMKGADITYTMLGGGYQDSHWQIQGELAKLTSTSRLIPAGHAGYISVGHRFGQFTPYVVLSRFRPERDAKTPVANWAAAGALAEAQNLSIAAYNSFRIDQRTVALGLRWDVDSNKALKLQWDRSEVGARGYGLWQVNNQIYGTESQRINVISATLEFVF